MRLFSIKEFFEKHHLNSIASHKRCPRAVRVIPSKSYQEQNTISLGSLCSDCSKVRAGDIFGKQLYSNMPSMHCSPCDAKHKQIYFSSIERQEEEDTERICLGHEYPLRLCEHFVLSLHQIKKHAKYRSHLVFSCAAEHSPTAGRPNCSECVDDNKPYFHCYKDDSGNLRLQINFVSHIRCKHLATRKICPKALRHELIQIRNISVPTSGKTIPFLQRQIRCVYSTQIFVTVWNGYPILHIIYNGSFGLTTAPCGESRYKGMGTPAGSVAVPLPAMDLPTNMKELLSILTFWNVLHRRKC